MTAVPVKLCLLTSGILDEEGYIEKEMQSKKDINHYTYLKGQIKALQNSCDEKLDEESDNEQECESSKESDSDDEDSGIQFLSTQFYATLSGRYEIQPVNHLLSSHRS